MRSGDKTLRVIPNSFLTRTFFACYTHPSPSHPSPLSLFFVGSLIKKMAETKKVKSPQDFMGGSWFASCLVYGANTISTSGLPDGRCFCCMCQQCRLVSVFIPDVLFCRLSRRPRLPQLSVSSSWSKIRMRWYVRCPIANADFLRYFYRSSRVVWLLPTRVLEMHSLVHTRRKASSPSGEVTPPT